jgi:hypothetical protein
MPEHALVDLPPRSSAALAAAALARPCGPSPCGQRAPDFDAWPEHRFRKRTTVDLSEIISGGSGATASRHRRPAFLPAADETALGWSRC